MRNLVVCCDGTWNTPDQTDGDLPAPTNVVRLRNALSEKDAAGGEQLAYYHPGVGSEGNWWQKLKGGSVGDGLDANIQSAYRWLCQNWKAGDRIFLFGFSRGAYTARSLAGFLCRCGLLDLAGLSEAEGWKRIGKAFDKGYRGRKDDWVGAWPLALSAPQTRVDFLGVWDTVGALGIPDNLAILNLLDDRRKYAFHDTELGAGVLQARHAVALDERRASFAPTLWTGVENDPRVKQLWFPGVHGDVGGGYSRTGLSDGGLQWMIEEARAEGLVFRPGMVEQVRPDHRGVLHDSCTGVFKLLRTQPRAVPEMAAAQVGRTLHASAFDRHRDPPITQAPYRPVRLLAPGESVELPVYAQQRWNDTGIWLEAGVDYDFSASGQWISSDVPCGPKGMKDGNFHKGEILHAVGALWGKVEGLFQKATGNDAADFRGTRRDEKAPWLALVGVVANDGNPGKDGTPGQPETFVIGEKASLRPKKAGGLHAFANDAWSSYHNNRGSVALVVTRRA